jgi:two-component system sensor histidine kinase MprB
MTLRLQIAIALGVLAAIAAVSAALFSYRSVDNRLEQETDAFLDDRVAQVLSFVATMAGLAEDDPLLPRGGGPANLNGSAAITRYDVEIRFLRSDGTTVASTPDADLPFTQTDFEQALGSQDPIPSALVVDDRTYETRLVGFDAPSGERIILHVGRDVTRQIETLEQLRFRLTLLAAAVVVSSAAAGYVLASRLVRPLDKLRGATRAVADTKDFSETITVKGSGEISDVAADFNLMLGELDESLRQQRRLVQDASHELRTPLSTLRATIELSQRMALRGHTPGDDPGEREHIALLSTALGEVDELSSLVDELVSLASFPFDETAIELLDLGDVTAEVVTTFRTKHPDRQLALSIGENEPTPGKRTHLARAIANVLANADKFSDAGTSIEVSVDRNRIVVNDRGPGILEADLERVFDKFYRSPTVQTIEGSGLGLAFVAEVVASHGGTVHAANRDGGGTTIELEISPGASNP